MARARKMREPKVARRPTLPDIPWRPLSPRLAYSGFYAGQFLFLGVQLPFYAGYLDAKGMSPQAIGQIFAIALVLRLLIAPALAFQSEKLSDPRRATRYASAGLAVSALLALIAPGPVLLSLATIGLLFSFGLMMPLTDSAVLRADKRGELSYGPVRSIGSASFIAANLLGGVVISALSDRAAVYWIALTAVMTFLIALALPRERSEGETRPPPDIGKAFILFRSRSFLYLLFASGCVQGSHAVYYTFSELSFSASGHPSWLIGAMWTCGVLAEIVFLVRGRKLMARLGPTGLLFIGAAGAIIRWPMLGLTPPVFILFPVQMLHVATFAATYMATVEFVGLAVPEEYRSTAMTIIASLGVGAMTGVATIFSGYIFEANNPFPAYLLMGGMGVLGLIFTLLLRHRWDGGILGAVKEA